MPPLLSILIPAYNEECYIQECLSSIQKASPADSEILIADDGSTDKTRSIAESFSARDRRITVIKSHTDGINRGEWITRNLCLELAKGKYVAFIDADDIVDHRRFETCLPLLEKNPEIDGILEAVGVFFENDPAKDQWGDMNEVFSHNPSIHPDGFLEATFDNRCKMLTPGLTVRRTLYQKSGVYGTKRICSEDFHLWLRMAACGRFALGEIEKPVVLYRRHAANTWIPNKYGSFRDLGVVGEVLAWAKKNPAVPEKNIQVLQNAFRNKLAHCQQMALDDNLIKEGINTFATATFFMPRLLLTQRLWANIGKLLLSSSPLSTRRRKQVNRR